MSPLESSRRASRREMRKTLVRLRLEMRRQELRHESLLLTQPLRQARDLTRNLDIPHASLWGMGVVAALGFLAARKVSSGHSSGVTLSSLLQALLRHL